MYGNEIVVVLERRFTDRGTHTRNGYISDTALSSVRESERVLTYFFNSDLLAIPVNLSEEHDPLDSVSECVPRLLSRCIEIRYLRVFRVISAGTSIRADGENTRFVVKEPYQRVIVIDNA